jgi:hypothetical protein
VAAEQANEHLGLGPLVGVAGIERLPALERAISDLDFLADCKPLGGGPASCTTPCTSEALSFSISLSGQRDGASPVITTLMTPG